MEKVFLSLSPTRIIFVDSLEQAQKICKSLIDREDIGPDQYVERKIGTLYDDSGVVIGNITYEGEIQLKKREV